MGYRKSDHRFKDEKAMGMGIDYHFVDEEITDEKAADHVVAETPKTTELNSLLSSSIYGKVRKSVHPYRGNIFKVPEFIRNGNVKAYEPQVLAIGPYHRGKNHLSDMEECKRFYLKKLLNRKGENSAYVSAMIKLEEKARACYVDSVNLSSDEFVEMMLLDACFIVELVRYYPRVAAPSWTLISLSRDLLLVENQLPFFVLQEFYDRTKESDEQGLCDMICKFFDSEFPMPICPMTQGLDSLFGKDSKHLLNLLHMSWIKCREESKSNSTMPRAFRCSINFNCRLLHLPRKWTVDNLPVVREPLRHNWRFGCSWFHSCNNWTSNILSSIFRLFNCCAQQSGSVPEEDVWAFIRYATELKEAGIKFKNIKSNTLFHVKYEKGVMEIPTLEVYDRTEPFFRNFIAYEQFHRLPKSIVIDYVILMDSLINTCKDVQLLRQCKIIVNGLGDDEILANMFNRLCHNVSFSSDTYMYNKIFREVNQHCQKSRNRWMASLRHNYFNTPWALISFLAALLLLLLTVVQTVFSVLAYINE